MRDYRLVVPHDCVASASEQDTQLGLDQMRTVLKADTRPSTELAAWELLFSDKGKSEGLPGALDQ